MIFHTLKWGAFIGFVAAGGVTVIFNVHKNDPTSSGPGPSGVRRCG